MTNDAASQRLAVTAERSRHWRRSGARLVVRIPHLAVLVPGLAHVRHPDRAPWTVCAVRAPRAAEEAR